LLSSSIETSTAGAITRSGWLGEVTI